MSQVLALLRLDLLRIRNWFRSFVGTKLVVLFGFAAVIALVVLVEYLMALSFFRFTALQAEFGRAVAQYAINATLLLVFLLAVASSIAASAGALYRPSFLRFLLTIPIAAGKLFVTRLVAALVQSTWVIVLLLTPILAAYGRIYSQGPDFAARTLTVLVLLAVASQAIGGMLTVVLVRRFGSLSRKSLAALFVFVIAGSLLMMRFLFPPAFFRLYYAEDWPTFQAQLGQLPLLSTSLPTNWLAKTLTGTWSGETVIAALSTVLLSIGAFWVGKSMYVDSWRAAHEGRFLAGKKVALKTESSRFPRMLKTPTGALLMNELLAVVRSPAEATYAAFLTGLTIVLLFMMRSVPALEKAAPQLLPAVYALSLVGLSYLFMTLTVRLVYPLMAKEKRSAWFIFSIPVKRETILTSKVAFALLLALPSLVLALVAGVFLQLPLALLVIFTLLVLLTTITVALLQLLLGTIAPNFAESDNLEAASTSGSGLTAINLSLAFIGISGYAFYKVAIGVTDGIAAVITMAFLAAVWLGLLYMLARRALHRYDL